MALSPIEANLPFPVPNQVDRLSSLPEELLISILSLLPTHIAARTSVLSRHFRHLWEASPSLDFSREDYPHPRDSNFLNMVDRALLRRNNTSHPLLSFRLDFYTCRPIISSLILKACSFDLCHLDIEGVSTKHIKSVLPAIFSIKSLQSLSLPTLAPLPSFYRDNHVYALPSVSILTRLTTLSVQSYDVRTTGLSQLLSQLPSLQDLRLGLCEVKDFIISSHTIKKLKLIVPSSTQRSFVLRLSLPLLESLHLQNGDHFPRLPTIRGAIPMLRKVVINLDLLRQKDAHAVNDLLRRVSHAEELILNMKEYEYEIHPFPVLLERGQELPKFPKLKHLDVKMCFHEDNFRAIISMLERAPALESVRLVHKIPKFTGGARQRKRKDWKSKLPRNPDRNYRYNYFKNLHLWENRKKLMNLLSKKLMWL